MDFEIGNILYIVITIVAVIIGVLGKKRKQAPGGPAGSESKARPSFMENLERVLTMGQEESVVADLQSHEEDLPAEELQQELREEVHSDFVRAPGIMEEYDRIMNSNTDLERDFIMTEGESMIEPLEVLDIDNLPGTDYFEIVKDFDAGTAVVYSAIINRLDI